MLVDEPAEKFGVYVCNVIVDDKAYPSVCNWGTKPTLNDATIMLEAHVLGTHLPDIVPGDSVHVQFVKFLRNIQAFQGLEQLKKQLEKDKADALGFLKFTLPR
jgi:riboflavin kinase/FMN adenylyltransferase